MAFPLCLYYSKTLLYRVQQDQLLLIIVTVIQYMRKQKTCLQITYQIKTNDYMILNKKPIIMMYFILSVYLENIVKIT